MTAPQNNTPHVPTYETIAGGFRQCRPLVPVTDTRSAEERGWDGQPDPLAMTRAILVCATGVRGTGLPEVGVSGERYVVAMNGKWGVRVRGVYLGTYGTVAEAVAVRDEWLASQQEDVAA